jgi:hypothetical protein
VRCFWLASVALFVVGCSSGRSQQQAQTEEPPQTPEQKLYEQIRSGHYQLASALDSLETASETSHNLAESQADNETKKAVAGLRAKIDKAGSLIGDFSEAPPPFDQFAKEVEAQDDERLKAIDAANESRTLLSEADATLRDMLDSQPPAEEKSRLATIEDSVEAALSTIGDAVVSMGGKAG